MNLRQRLHHRFPDLSPERLIGGFDLVGDIAVIILPQELETRQEAIGETILETYRNVRVVAKRAGTHGGEYRLLPLSVIAGEPRLRTVHRENGLTLHLDLAQVYFSVRLAHERARIASQVRPGEQVAVLCSGIGPFPLIIARHSAAHLVVGIEKNPQAHHFALKNLACNRAISPVRLFQGEATALLPQLGVNFDRILIVLPRGGEALLPSGLAALKPGGRLHLYAMQAKGCHAATLEQANRICHSVGRLLTEPRITVCGRSSPTVHRVCLDAVIA